ncbi:MAG: InlB B-repeat-containing protein, partial [Prevotellaceae bacterium]|nr:InlB B-repeat-containing protein [Prevotellaceae bacterium]
SVTYDGLPHGVGTLTLSPQFTGAGAIAATYYTGVSGAAYAKTTVAPTNAGVYALTAAIDFDENTSFRDTSVSVGTLTIRKATPAAVHLAFAPDSSLTYDGLPHEAPVTKKGSPYSGMGSITVKYNGKRSGKPVNADVYDITVDVGEGANFCAANDMWLGTLTINKATPAAEHLVFTPSVIAGYDGLPQAFPVSPDNSRYSGMGAITVKYDGSVAPPVNMGKYAVAVDISAGTNFGSASGLELGTLTIRNDAASQYLVIFAGNGGSPVPAQTVEEGATVTRPADPTKAGHTFGGWYADANLTALWDFAANRVTTETTLYAKWEGPVPAKLDSIRINGVPQEVKDTIEFSIPCDSDKKAVAVQYFCASGAGTLYIDASRSFLTDTAITITDQGQSKQYTLRLKNRFEFGSIVQSQLGGRLLMVVKNPESNGGFNFQTITWWHKDGRYIKNDKFYYASPSGEAITDTLCVRLLDARGTWFESCPSNPHAAAAAPAALNMAVYPNPVAGGAAIHLKEDFDIALEERYETFYLLDIQGKMAYAGKTSELRNGIAMPKEVGIYLLVIEGKAGRLLNKVVIN